MFSYRRNYNKRYENENKYDSSSLSNVYRELIQKPNRSNAQSESRNSSNYKSIPVANYHFIQRSINRSQNKSVSPPNQSIYNYNNNIQNITKNFRESYNPRKLGIDNYYQRELNRNNLGFVPIMNKSNSKRDIFYNNNNNSNNISTYNQKNFYDTIANFGKGGDVKEGENLNKNNNRASDIVYKNYFNDKQNSSFVNYFSRPNQNNQSYYSNNNIKSFDIKNNYYGKKDYYEHLSPNKKINYDNSPLKMTRGYSLKNAFNKNLFFGNKKTDSKIKVEDYFAYTMGGTNGFGSPKTNQDSYVTKVEKNTKNENEYTFGVFDGHGTEGHLVSQAIKQFFINSSFYDYQSKQLVLSIFASLSQLINNSTYFDNVTSGSTAILVHVTNEKLIVANVGDSRAILITRNKELIELSNDHKPELPEEKERIEASGGRVDKIFGMGPYRVWFRGEDYPGLAMSRSIGDKLAHKVGVIDIPEIREYDINDIEPLALILASDGVWEFMPNEEVKNIVLSHIISRNKNFCARDIVERARAIWQKTGYAIDDITCVVAFFTD